MKDLFLKLLMGVLCVFMMLLSGTSYAQELVVEKTEAYNAIVVQPLGTHFEERDSEFADANRITVNPYGYVRLTVDDDAAVNMHYEYSLTVDITPIKVDGSPDTGAMQTKTLKIVYNPFAATSGHVDLSQLDVKGAYGVRVRVKSFQTQQLSVANPPAPTPTTPTNVKLVYGFRGQRYHALESGMVAVGQNPAITDTGLKLTWTSKKGAVYYDVEWTWVDRYGDNLSGLLDKTAIDLSEEEFARNSTRVQVDQSSAPSFTIPLVYDAGYVVYRVRPVGVFTDDVSKWYPGPWSSGTGTKTTVDSWPDKKDIGSHDARKNWQFSATYAEQGKHKEVVSYHDAVLYNRQTVTRINTEDKAVVGEVIYDNEGRAAIEVLPVPVNDKRLRYYEKFNQNSNDAGYSHLDFDWAASANSCAPTASIMKAGAAGYYGNQSVSSNSYQDYVPDAEGYPFSQTEYDKTGRVSRKSGVGKTHQLNSGHEMKYYYGRAYQPELNRLFGYRVGHAKHYKKNMVFDPNGQGSISYIDPAGRTIATALIGSPGNTSLLPLDDHNDAQLHKDITIDLLNKLTPTAVDTEVDDNDYYRSWNHGTLYDGLKYSDNMLVASDATSHKFLYDFKQPNSFNYTYENITNNNSGCGVTFPFNYVLEISVKDVCDVEKYPKDAALPHYTVKINSGTHSDNPTFVLNQGAYKVYKKLRVDEEELEKHAQEFLAKLTDKDNAACYIRPDSLGPSTGLLTDCDFTCQECDDQLGSLETYVLNELKLAYNNTSFSKDTGSSSVDVSSIPLGFTTIKWTDSDTDINGALAIDGAEVKLRAANAYEGWQSLKIKCDAICEREFALTATGCQAGEAMLLNDIGVAGQYGSVDFSAVSGGGSAILDPTSVFNEKNSLYYYKEVNGVGQIDTEDNNWRFPVGGMYKNEEGEQAYIEVLRVSEGVYNPPIKAANLIHIVTGSDDSKSYWVKPKDLANVSDFIANFELQWREQLLPYHPEYPYLEYARKVCQLEKSQLVYESATHTPQNPTTLNPDSYNAYLHSIKSFAHAVQAKILNADGSLVEANNKVSLIDNDPYFTNAVVDNGGVAAFSHRHFNIMDYAVRTAYIVQGGVNKPMMRKALEASLCNGLSSNCTPVFPTGSSTADVSNRDQIWKAFRGMYISYKTQIRNMYMEAYARKRGSFNYCIGDVAASVPVLTRVIPNYSEVTVMQSYLDEHFVNTNQICGNDLKILFKEKQRRFLPSDLGATDLVSDSGQQGENTYYQSTGVCPLAVSLESYLNGLTQMSAQGLAAPTGSTNFTGNYLSPSLYEAFTGVSNTNNTITIDRSIANDKLTIAVSTANASVCSSQVILDLPSQPSLGKTWAQYDHGNTTSNWHIIGFKQIYFDGIEENTGLYKFKAVATVRLDGVINEYLITGRTCAKIGNCETSSTSPGNGEVLASGGTVNLLGEPTCEDVLKFETSFRKLLNALKGNIGTNVPLSGTPEYASDAFLPVFLGDNTTVISGVWSHTAPSDFKLTIGSATPLVLSSTGLKAALTASDFIEVIDVDVVDYTTYGYDAVKIKYKKTGANNAVEIATIDAQINPGIKFNCCNGGDAHRFVPNFVLRLEELESNNTVIKSSEIRFSPRGTSYTVGELMDVDFKFSLGQKLSGAIANINASGTNLTINGVTYTLGNGLDYKTATTSVAGTSVSAVDNRIGTTVSSEYPWNFEMYNFKDQGRTYGMNEGSGTTLIPVEPTISTQLINLSSSGNWVTSPETGVHFSPNFVGSFTHGMNTDFTRGVSQRIAFKITPKAGLTRVGSSEDYRGFIGKWQYHPNSTGTKTRSTILVYMSESKKDCDDCIPKPPVPTPCAAAYDKWKGANGMNFDANGKSGLVIDYYEDLTSGTYRKDNFCNLNYQYLVDGYLYYINKGGLKTPGNTTARITSVDDVNFLTLNEFGNTALGYGYQDVNTVIDAFASYYQTAAANTNTDDDYTFADYITNVYMKQYTVCPPAPMTPAVNLPLQLPPDDCVEEGELINAAYQNAAYQEYLASLVAKFKEEYIKQALATVQEQFTKTAADREYQYTLYYYDQAGNLKQTVPPEGVHRFDVSDGNTSSPNNAINAHRLRNEYNDTNETNDENGNLVPKHRLETQYMYNSLNQLVWQETPDGGVTRFAYDKLGRIIASQNANQKEAKDGKIRFSYTLYDPLGRIEEAGEILVPATATTTVASYVISDIGRLQKVISGQSNVDVDGFEESHAKQQVTRTHYDKVVDFGNSTNSGSYFYPALSSDESFNYRNRIAAILYYNQVAAGSTAVTGYNYGIYYRYNIHGNVKELVNHQPAMYLNNTEHHLKRMHYEYDLVSGNVNRVYYQKDKEDQFIHKYSYDVDNRIVDVYTSSNGSIWEREANYKYYEHGSLARVLLGDKRVQAMDYAYTLQGWLKAINSETGQVADDMGHDGDATNNAAKHIARDAFGYSLSYFSKDPSIPTNNPAYQYNKDDYKARFPGAVKTVGVNNTITRDVYRYTNAYAVNTTVSEANVPENNRVGLPGYLNLYNGNIKQMVTAVRDVSSATGDKVYGSLNRYQYDQLNRIKKLRGSLVDHDGSNYTTVKPNVTLGDYSFDRSGNLTALKRSMPDASNPTTGRKVIDDFTYKYQHELFSLDHNQGQKKVKKRNQLLAVYDAVGVQMNDDLMNQLTPMQTTNDDFNETTGQHDNYKYDKKGQLTHDYTEKLQISWRVDGKVAKVERFKTFVYKTLPEKHILKDRLKTITFQYDGLGNRVAKKVTSYNNNGDATGDEIHYYVRDAQANVMALYKYNKPTSQTPIGPDLILPRNGVPRTITGTADDEKAFKTITVCSENNTLTYHIEPTGSQLMQAGEVITLKPGFHAKEGSTFHAKIEAVASNTLSQELVEHHIYGSKRLGIKNKTQALSTTAPTTSTDIFVSLSRKVGDKNYELSNHLGNVLSVVNDKKLPVFNTTGTLSYFKPEVLARNEYMPYGMPVYGRSQSGNYRYGFQGQEKDKELKNGDGNSINYKYRMHDPRVGRFFAVDPLAPKYPHNSPYAFSENRVIDGIELEGREFDDYLFAFKIREGDTYIKISNELKVKHGIEISVDELRSLNGYPDKRLPVDRYLGLLSLEDQMAYDQSLGIAEIRDPDYSFAEDLFVQLVSGKYAVQRQVEWVLTAETIASLPQAWKLIKGVSTNIAKVAFHKLRRSSIKNVEFEYGELRMGDKSGFSDTNRAWIEGEGLFLDFNTKGTSLKGRDMYDFTTTYFKGKYSYIKDVWVHGDNLRVFNRLMRSKHMTKELAALNTWSGRQAARLYGKGNVGVRIKSYTKNSAGGYDKVNVDFYPIKPKG